MHGLYWTSGSVLLMCPNLFKTMLFIISLILVQINYINTSIRKFATRIQFNTDEQLTLIFIMHISSSRYKDIRICESNLSSNRIRDKIELNKIENSYLKYMNAFYTLDIKLPNIMPAQTYNHSASLRSISPQDHNYNSKHPSSSIYMEY